MTNNSILLVLIHGFSMLPFLKYGYFEIKINTKFMILTTYLETGNNVTWEKTQDLFSEKLIIHPWLFLYRSQLVQKFIANSDIE